MLKFHAIPLLVKKVKRGKTEKVVFSLCFCRTRIEVQSKKNACLFFFQKGFPFLLSFLNLL